MVSVMILERLLDTWRGRAAACLDQAEESPETPSIAGGMRSHARAINTCVVDLMALLERETQHPTFYICHVCWRSRPAEHGGLASTGDIDAPNMRWMCNGCLMDKVSP